MSEYIHLIGAESVQQAGNNISSAADTMYRAASSIEQSVDNLRQMMDEFFDRLHDANNTDAGKEG